MSLPPLTSTVGAAAGGADDVTAARVALRGAAATGFRIPVRHWKNPHGAAVPSKVNTGSFPNI